MRFYLYRKPQRYVILPLLAALLSSLTLGQWRKKEKGPRALAIVELPQDPKSSARLIPIAILDHGQFFDASVYLASPRPMAIDTGVVYEAERAGDPVGFFTVEGSRQVNGNWIALGSWQSQAALAAAVRAKKKAGASHADDDERPTLKRPAASSGSQELPATSAPKAAKKTTAAAEESESPIPPLSEQSDPNRPILRRGKPPTKEHDEAEFNAPVSLKSATRGNSNATVASFKDVWVAISDAGGPDPKPFQYRCSSDELQNLTRQMTALAVQLLAKYAKAKPGLKSPPVGSFEQFDLKTFDLFYDNNPELVFTGRARGQVNLVSNAKQPSSRQESGDFFYYVTVVARQEPDLGLRQLFASATDTGHLDAFPRLELVDAVDAEGKGGGNLLFRALTDEGRSYILYRVTRDTLWKLFEGGSGAP